MRGVAAATAAGAVLFVIGCGGPTVSPSVEEEPRPALSQADAAELLVASWMAQAARDPAGVTALLDAPGGAGWLDLYHGDIASAMGTFSSASSASARLGRARADLARADALLAAARLHREAALELVRYRRDHRDRLRTGRHELALAVLVAHHADAPSDELATFSARASEQSPGQGDLDRALRALIADDAQRPESLPEMWRARLAFADAVSAGDMDAATALAITAQMGGPDLRDPMGEDAEAGVQFEGLFYDPSFLTAAARYHLASAWVAASELPGVGDAIDGAVRGAWGGELPAGLSAEAAPGEAPLPAWAALFASPWVDRADWDAHWTGSDRAFLTRFAEKRADVPIGGTSSLDVDDLLRAVAQAEEPMVAALKDGAGPEGVALVDDLRLVRPVQDRVLRARMAQLVDEGHAAQARRLAERSLDPNPGSRGGPTSSARTRVSWRNDRAFLVDLARCLWRAGQPGGALDLVHPLAEEDPALQSVKHYLGQLDAAASIGLQGKTSQL